MSMKQFAATAATVAASFSVFFGTAMPTSANDGGSASACMSGTVDGWDDASYDENFGADRWKNISGVNLSSDNQKVVLSVLDDYGNSICQNTADLTTSCKFQTGFASTFTILLDNTQNSGSANYTVCSF